MDPRQNHAHLTGYWGSRATRTLSKLGPGILTAERLDELLASARSDEKWQRKERARAV